MPRQNTMTSRSGCCQATITKGTNRIAAKGHVSKGVVVSAGWICKSRVRWLITIGPAEILGLPLGRLDLGRLADICIFDPDALWVPSESTLFSQGRNTPFIGEELAGRVSCTLLAGRVVFQRDSA